MGNTSFIVYEDGGDINLLDVETGARNNLTASPELDSDPIPSPDGRYILWTILQEGADGEGPGFWLMRADGTEKKLPGGGPGPGGMGFLGGQGDVAA